MSLRIEKQKRIGIDVLDRLICSSFFHPESLIAGGAPRDWYAGKEAKDIDIFAKFGRLPAFEIDHDEVKKEFEKLKNVPGLDLKNAKAKIQTKQRFENYLKKSGIEFSNLEVLGDTVRYCKFTAEFEVEGEKVQTIISRDVDVLQVILSFDFGLNKIWINKDDEQSNFWQHTLDFENCKLTLYPQMMLEFNQWTRLPERKRRMLEKYPNFTLDFGDLSTEQIEEIEKLKLEHKQKADTEFLERLKFLTLADDENSEIEEDEFFEAVFSGIEEFEDFSTI